MKFRKIAFIAVTAAALVPAISNASPEKTSVTACARAFAGSMATANSAAPTFKLDYQVNRYAGSLIEHYPHDYTFELQANDPKTGAAIARARCSTNSHGEVTALSALPLDAEPLSARL